MKKFVSVFLIAILILSVAIPAFATELIGFDDVPESHWAYSAIMEMAKQGYIYGVTNPDTNGIAHFDFNAPMTRAQFITILMRYIYPEETAVAESRPQGQYWWSNTEDLAREKGLLSSTAFHYVMDQNCPRDEMCSLLIKAANQNGEDTRVIAEAKNLTDIYNTDTLYSYSIRQAIALGLVNGYEDNTFRPKNAMTRAEASAVIYRLIDKSARLSTKQTPTLPTYPFPTMIAADGKDIAYGDQEGYGNKTYVWTTYADLSRANITFNEGEVHPIPIPGDVVVKADGTKVTCIVQGGMVRAPRADIWTGAEWSSGLYIHENSGGFFANDGSSFHYDENHQELLTGSMWSRLATVLKPNSNGTYKGEVRNEYYVWQEYFEGTGTFHWQWIGGDG